MNLNKRRQLEANGWKVGNIQEFLHLTTEQMIEVENSIRKKEELYHKLKENPINSVQYYLVKYESNWADEMDIKGLALLTDKDKKYFEKLNPSEKYPIVHYVGTNEDIEYTNLSQLLKCYKWIPISLEEYKLIEKLIGTSYGHFFYPEDFEDDEW